MPELPSHHPDNPLGTPFREEVPIEDFSEIHRIRKEIVIAKGLFDRPEEKPLVSRLMQEQLMSPTTPNEVKLEIYQGQIDLLDTDRDIDANKALAASLIDSIRTQDDPGIRIRLTSKLSHHLQTQYESHWDTPEARVASIARRAAFQDLAHSQNSDDAHRQWARYILEPRGILQVFNELYERETELVVTPRVIEEITEESEGLEPEEDAVTPDLIFSGNLVRLQPPSLPTLDKIRQYKEMTGRDLPLFITQHMGTDRIHVQFPADLTARAARLVDDFRSDSPSISKDEIFEEARKLQAEFVEMMNEEQRREIQEGANVEVRFSTTRDTSTLPQEAPHSIEEHIDTQPRDEENNEDPHYTRAAD